MHEVEDILRGLDDVHLAAVGGRRAVGVEVCRRREGLVEERILAVPGAGVEINYIFVVVGRKGQTARGCGGGRGDNEGEEGGGDNSCGQHNCWCENDFEE